MNAGAGRPGHDGRRDGAQRTSPAVGAGGRPVAPGRTGRESVEGRRLRRAVGLVAGMVCLAGTGHVAASVVSRLGEVYLYDPLTFDAGSLQRGGWVRGGAGTGGGNLEVALETSFFRDFSARIGYLQRFNYGQENGLDLTWRLRFPVIESARFRHFTSTQFYYQGSHGFQAVDETMPSLEIGAAESMSFPVAGVATSFHAQLGVALRPLLEVPGGVDPARTGPTVRLAYLFQLYRPARGRAGLWTVTFSVIEVSAVWFGVPGKPGSAGRMSLAAAAPAIHFSSRGACYTLGLAPRLTWRRGIDGSTWDWAGLATLAISYRGVLE